MAVHRALALLFVIIVPQLVVEGCWPSKPAKRPMSRCEKERADGGVKVFVKQCDPDGKYSTTQCGGSRRFCYCAHPDTGVLFMETKKRGQPSWGCENYFILREDQRTPCEKQMFSAYPEMLPGGFIKECGVDGSFRKEQCNAEGLCFCVNKETGELYGQTGSRGQINCAEYEAVHDAPKAEVEATLCEKQKFSRNPAMLPGGFIKQCEADGSFRKEQCNAEGLCFCVNKETGELYGQTGSRGQINCAEYEAVHDAPKAENGRTPCEKQRDSDNPAMLPGGFIKQCEADGSFRKEQCNPEGLCFCVNTETGELYPEFQGSPGQINCDEYEAMAHTEAAQDERTPCEKQRDSDNPAMLPGGFIKQCEEDGSFRKEQCNPEGLCFCVNTETGELYGQTGSPGQISCAEYEERHAAGENWNLGR